jgi:hypothetical protein
MLAEEGSDEEYAGQEEPEEEDPKPDKEYSDYEASRRCKRKKQLWERRTPKPQKCVKPQTPSLRQARSNFLEIVSGARERGNYGKFMSKRTGKHFSPGTDRCFCRECHKC